MAEEVDPDAYDAVLLTGGTAPEKLRRNDVVNAGGLYENTPVVHDGNLITSRRPDDLAVFMREFVAAVNAM